MYAPHASLAPDRPATLGRIAVLGLPLLLASSPVWLIDWINARLLDPDGSGGRAAADLPTVGLPAESPAVVSTRLAGTSPHLAPTVCVIATAAALTALAVAYRLLRPSSRRMPGPSRCITWHGVGTGLAGLTALLPVLGDRLGVSVLTLAPAVTAGSVAVSAAYMPALLSLPGPRPALAVRLRRALDGTIVGLSLTFCAWVVLVAPHGRLGSPAFWIVSFHCCVLSTAVIAGGRHTLRSAPVLCAAGICAATAGLPALGFGLAHDAPTWSLAPVAAVLVAASALIWRGAPALGPTCPIRGPGSIRSGRSEPCDASPNVRRESWSGSVIAGPAALALAVALYRLATGGAFDRAEMMLGTLAALAVGLRQLLTGLTTRSHADPDHAGSVAGGPARSLPVVPRPRSEADIGRSMDADPVTGLPNDLRTTVSIAAMRCGRRPAGAFLIVGVDGMDAAPGAARAEALRATAWRLREITAQADRACGAGPGAAGGVSRAEPDLPARWSATEFAVLTPANLAQAYGLANRLATALAEPVRLAGDTLRLSACVGLTDLAGATSTSDVVRRAHVALRRARQLGPGRVEWYDSVAEEAVARQEILERELPGALRRDELDLVYQPIMDLDGGRPLAVEALLRWRHPQLGTLLPADVIPLAEQTGLIADVDRWVLRRAVAQLASWHQDGRDLSMAINVSPRELRTEQFTNEVAAALADHDLAPGRLVVEFAESGIEEEGGLDDRVAALRSLGVRTALDEFGDGVASLAHLRCLPIDMVKVGRSFFDHHPDHGPARPAGPGAGPGDVAPLIEVMVGVGRRLGVDVVAQGVEAPAQLAVVRTAGCKFGQGHLFARPQPVEHTEAYLDGFAGGRSVGRVNVTGRRRVDGVDLTGGQGKGGAGFTARRR